MDAVKSGQVDSILASGSESHIVRLMDQHLVRENELLVEELSRSNKELKDFCHVAAHDLKAPLRHVRYFAQMILDDEANRHSEESRGFLHRIDSVGSSMQDHLDGLLHLANVGGSKITQEPLDLSTVLSQVVDELHMESEEVDAIVDIDDLLVVDADRLQMKQLF